MSLRGTFAVIISACGITIQTSKTVEAQQGIEPVDLDLPAGNAGSLTTRTDNDTGVATLSAGHGLITNDKVDVYWDGGVRYGMVATVAVNEITLEGGAGDNLPDEDTAIVVTKQVSLDVTFDGDNLLMIAATGSKRTHLQFLDSNGATIKAADIEGGAAWSWEKSSGVANTLAGNAVASVQASNGVSTAVSNLKMVGLQYAVE